MSGKLPPSFCHCGRHLAIITAPDSEWLMWRNAADDKNPSWVDMASEFCQPCWDVRCDTAEGVCP